MAGSTGRDWQLTWPVLLARSSGLLTACSSTTRIANAELPRTAPPARFIVEALGPVDSPTPTSPLDKRSRRRRRRDHDTLGHPGIAPSHSGPRKNQPSDRPDKDPTTFACPPNRLAMHGWVNWSGLETLLAGFQRTFMPSSSLLSHLYRPERREPDAGAGSSKVRSCRTGRSAV
jgi:hypothetical protein